MGTESPWVRANDRKPPEWQEVLVSCKHDEHDCAQWTGTEWVSTVTDFLYEVEFWMLIPESPNK